MHKHPESPASAEAPGPDPGAALPAIAPKDSSAAESRSHAPRRKLSWALAFVLLAAIATAFAFLMFSKAFEAPGAVVDKGMEVAERVRKAISDTANITPRVVVNDTVVYEQSSSILELALTSRQTLVEREMDHTWLGSTKRVKLRGTYEVKAGFDLSRPFSVVMDEGKATVNLPPARILSVEPLNLEVRMLRDGLWNKINPEDVELEVNSLNLMAREKMLQENIDGEAEKEIVRRLRERLGEEIDLEIRIGESPPIPLLKG